MTTSTNVLPAINWSSQFLGGDAQGKEMEKARKGSGKGSIHSYWEMAVSIPPCNSFSSSKNNIAFANILPFKMLKKP